MAIRERAAAPALPKFSDCEFSWEFSAEEIPVEGNASAIDPVTDARVENRIRRELELGNNYAWCRVIVTARWGEHAGHAATGTLSYWGKNAEKKLRRDLEDVLTDEAYENLCENIRNICPHCGK